MQAVAAVARASRLGSARSAGWITELHHGLLRSALTGEADAILVAPRLRDQPTSADARREHRRDRSGSMHGRPPRRRPLRRELPRHERRRRAVPRGRGHSSRAQAGDAAIIAGDANLRPGAERPTAACCSAASRRRCPAASTRSSCAGFRRRRRVALARRAAARRRPAPLRSRAGRTHRRMTFEEARAQFPVLERYAYLNAGTNGPLAAGDRRRGRRADASAISSEGRSGKAYFERILELREEARRGLAAVLDVDPLHVALTDSTLARLLDRALRPRPRRRGRGRDDRPGALRPDGGRVRDRVRASSSSTRDGGRDPRRGHAAHAAHRHVARALDDRAAARPARVREDAGVPVLVDGAQSAGAIAVGRGRLRLLHGVGAEVALRAGADRRALRARPGAAANRGAVDYLAGRRTSRPARSSRRTARRASTPAGSASPILLGLDAALAAHPGVALRAGGRDGGTLPRAARSRSRGRDAAGALDARLVPPDRRPGGARRAAARAGRDRARATRAATSSARRAAGGRTRTTCSGSPPASAAVS